jgi:hypothetical protein
MELFIQIRDGQPYEHPILGDNFRAVFPGIDPDNLPPEFARFERIPEPRIGPYQVNQGVTYEWVDGVVKDVWHIREMTAEEKLAKQNEVKQRWAEIDIKLLPPESLPELWVFDETNCLFRPPPPTPVVTL